MTVVSIEGANHSAQTAANMVSGRYSETFGFTDKGYDAVQAIEVDAGSDISVTHIGMMFQTQNAGSYDVWARKNGDDRWFPILSEETFTADQLRTLELDYRIEARYFRVIERSGSLSGSAPTLFSLHDDPSVAGFGTIDGPEPVSVHSAHFASAATSHTYAWPATEDGDVAVLYWANWNSSNGMDASSMSGWTSIFDLVHGDAQSQCAYYVCDGTESGNITIELDASLAGSMMLYILRGIDTSDVVDVSDTDNSSGFGQTSRNPNADGETAHATTVTTTSADALVIDHVSGNLNFNLYFPDYDEDAPTSGVWVWSDPFDGDRIPMPGICSMEQWDAYQFSGAFIKQTAGALGTRYLSYASGSGKEGVSSTVAFNYDGSHSYEHPISPAHTDTAPTSGTVEWEAGEMWNHEHDQRNTHNDGDWYGSAVISADDKLIHVIFSEDDDAWTNPVSDGYTLDETFINYGDSVGVEYKDATGSESDPTDLNYNSGSTLTGRRNATGFLFVISDEGYGAGRADTLGLVDIPRRLGRFYATHGSVHGDDSYWHMIPQLMQPGDVELVILSGDAVSVNNGALSSMTTPAGWTLVDSLAHASVGNQLNAFVYAKTYSAVELSTPLGLDFTPQLVGSTGNDSIQWARMVIPASTASGGVARALGLGPVAGPGRLYQG